MKIILKNLEKKNGNSYGKVVIENGQLVEGEEILVAALQSIIDKEFRKITVETETLAIGNNGELQKRNVEHLYVFGTKETIEMPATNINDLFKTRYFARPGVKDIDGKVMEDIFYLSPSDFEENVTVFSSLDEFYNILRNIKASSEIDLVNNYTNGRNR